MTTEVKKQASTNAADAYLRAMFLSTGCVTSHVKLDESRKLRDRSPATSEADGTGGSSRAYKVDMKGLGLM